MKNKGNTKKMQSTKETKNLQLPILPKWTFWLLGIVSFFLYAGTLKYGYVLDDIAVIENNLFVQKGIGGIPEILSTFYWEGYTSANAGLFRPISLVMFAIEHALSPSSPTLHHFVNILFYALSSMLLLRILLRWMPTINPWFFFFVTFIFAVHPIHTEVVANIKSRDEIMAFFFFLVCCHFLYRNMIRTTWDAIFGGCFFFLALLSKEGALVFLPILLLLELRSTVELKKRLISFAPLLALTVIWFVWHQWVVGQSTRVPYTYHDNALLATSSISEQKATAFGIFLQYELKAFFPYLMSYDYSFPYFPIVGWSSPVAWLGLLSVLGGIAGIVYFFKKNFLLSFGWSLLIFPLLITGNILFTIGTTMADRFLYVSVLGAAILLVIAVGRIRKTSANHGYAPGKVAVFLAPLIVVFCYMTVQRNAAWKSNDTLFSTDYLTTPESARVQYNYATLLQRASNDDPTRSTYRQAMDVYSTALTLDSGSVESSINLGRMYLVGKSYSEAKNVFEKGLRSSKTNPDLWGGKGESEFYLNDKKAAATSLDKAIQFGNTLPGVFILRGTIAFETNQFISAATIFKTGLNYHPENGNLLLNLGNVYGATKNFEKALETFQKLREVEPNNAQAVYYLGMIYKELGQEAKSQEMMNLYAQMTSQR